MNAMSALYYIAHNDATRLNSPADHIDESVMFVNTLQLFVLLFDSHVNVTTATAIRGLIHMMGKIFT